VNSPDLIASDYIVSGFLKEKIFTEMPQTIMELRALIIQASNQVTENTEDTCMCGHVINVIVSVEEVSRSNGDHVEHFIHGG
jgi:hypothetical protein